MNINSSKENKIPLEKLYGENAIDLVMEEIKRLALNSNILFDKEFVELGISFILIKSHQIIKGEKSFMNLKFLVTESFGEAAIYKYNIKGDK